MSHSPIDSGQAPDTSNDPSPDRTGHWGEVVAHCDTLSAHGSSVPLEESLPPAADPTHLRLVEEVDAQLANLPKTTLDADTIKRLEAEMNGEHPEIEGPRAGLDRILTRHPSATASESVGR